jgi:hypothetical protein
MSLVSAVLDGFVRVGTEFKSLRSRTISAGTGLTGGGDLTVNRTLALSAATQASLAKADTALQSGAVGATGPQGPAGGSILLPANATSTPLTTPPGTLVGYRK